MNLFQLGYLQENLIKENNIKKAINTLMTNGYKVSNS